MKIFQILIASLILLSALLTGCTDDAYVASRNLSKSADMFELNRRVVFYNGITNTYILTIEGLCSLEGSTKNLAVICKVGPRKFKKHYLGLSDNVTYFSEQLEPTNVNVYRYRVIFKPEVIIPNIKLRTSN